MKTVRSFYDKYHMEIGNIVLILILAIVLFPRLSADYVLHQFVIIVLLTMGLSLEMLSGVLDFAFMAEIAMVTCLGGLCLRAGFPVWVSLTVMILAQMLFGMAKGLLIGKIRVNPILLTFILQQIYQGIAAVFGDAIQAPIPRDYYGSYMFWMIFSGIAVVIYVFLQLLLTHTYYGKYVRMLGENETSVKNSGIRFDICPGGTDLFVHHQWRQCRYWQEIPVSGNCGSVSWRNKLSKRKRKPARHCFGQSVHGASSESVSGTFSLQLFFLYLGNRNSCNCGGYFRKGEKELKILSLNPKLVRLWEGQILHIIKPSDRYIEMIPPEAGRASAISLYLTEEKQRK